MKKFLCAGILGVLAAPAMAAEVGIGVSIQSDDSWIYVPIDITPSFRLEPSLRFRDLDSTSVSELSNNPRLDRYDHVGFRGSPGGVRRRLSNFAHARIRVPVQ